jgi:hypothetical protein
MTQVNVVENEPNSNGLGTTRNDHHAPTPISHALSFSFSLAFSGWLRKNEFITAGR